MGKSETQNTISLYGRTGQRLYLTQDERVAFMRAAKEFGATRRTFCHLLAITGCRISEGLNLTDVQADIDENLIIFESLKKRRRCIYRAVPVPESFIRSLRLVHGIRGVQAEISQKPPRRIWPYSRSTGYRWIKEAMIAAQIPPGPHRTPKGLRHGLGVAAALNSVPPGKVKSWLGHSRLETTMIYFDAVGEEERRIAERIWL